MLFRRESKDMNWELYFSLTAEAFYIAVKLAGVDIEFHIHNLRGVDDEFEKDLSPCCTKSKEVG